MNERIDKLITLERYASGIQLDFAAITEIYSLNNYFLPQFYETVVGCGSCQERTKERVFNWYNEVGALELKEFRDSITPPQI